MTKPVSEELEALEAFFKLSDDIMLIASHTGHFTHVNTACEKMLGYTAFELVGRPWIDFVHEDDKKKTMDEAVKLRTGGRSVLFENRYVTRDGSVKTLRWKTAYSDDGKRIFAIATVIN
jgi:PAS domain S-box-containing protein